MITMLFIWNLALTACVIGNLFRVQGLRYEVNHIHVRNLATGLGTVGTENTAAGQDNEASR
jgi:hypothetical protein